MDQKNINTMFDLIKSAVSGEVVPDDRKRELSDDELKEILVESKKQDSLHLVAHGLYINGMLTPDSKYFDKAQQIQATAMFRRETQKHVFEQLCNFFEEERIDFMPLKGSVIRDYYREGWLRTSCDIDILIHEEDGERAVNLLIEKCGYNYEFKNVYDYSLFSPEKIHLELHFDYIGNYISDASYELIKNVWETTSIKKGYSFWHEMPDEIFYYFHITHVAKHFLKGGCGIKPFIDMLILENLEGAEKEKRDELLEKGNLLKFTENIRKLYRVWFLGEAHDNTTIQMQEYVLYGGVYGNYENEITLAQQRKGGKFGYIISRLFMRYDLMVVRYPILLKHKYLLPFYWLRRWIDYIFKRSSKNKKELEMFKNISDKKANDIKSCLSELGL